MSRPLLCAGCNAPILGEVHRPDDGRPLDADCAHVRRSRGLDGPGRDAAPIRGNAFGVDESGRQPGRCDSAWYRPPQAARDLHHDEPIVLNRTLLYQQAPPVAVSRSRPSPISPSSWSGRGAASGSEAADAALDVTAMLADVGPLTDRDRRVLELYAELPNIDAVLLDPDSVVIPKAPATLYAVATALGMKANPQNFGRVARFAERLTEAQHGEFAALLHRK